MACTPWLQHRVLGESPLDRRVVNIILSVGLELAWKCLLGFYLPGSLVSLPHCWGLLPTCLPPPGSHSRWMMGMGGSESLCHGDEVMLSYCQKAGPCQRNKLNVLCGGHPLGATVRSWLWLRASSRAIKQQMPPGVPDSPSCCEKTVRADEELCRPGRDQPTA